MATWRLVLDGALLLAAPAMPVPFLTLRRCIELGSWSHSSIHPVSRV